MARWSVGDILKKWRSARGWTLDELHAKSGVNKNTLSRIERGGEFKQKSIDAICEAYGKSQYDLHAELSQFQTNSKPAWLCDNPEHADLHRKLELILHGPEKWRMAIIGNIDAMVQVATIHGPHGSDEPLPGKRLTTYRPTKRYDASPASA